MLKTDVIIVGGGLAGLKLANLLAHQKVSCILCDAQPSPIKRAWAGAFDLRVSAINAGSKAMFEQLDLWDDIEKMGASPYTKMHVWDALSDGVVDFNSDEIAESELGHIIENRVMQKALYQGLKPFIEAGQCQTLYGDACTHLTRKLDRWHLNLNSGAEIVAPLIIGADGARSWLRKTLDIETSHMFYGQHALVAVVETEHPHQKTAYQRFLPTGPLAFLPLTPPNTCSIVWSTLPDDADQLTQCEEAEFNDQITEALGGHLGKVSVVSERRTFPLHEQHAKEYVREGVALLGDAAHTLHPLAGQGINLGFADAHALSKALQWAKEKNRPYASLMTLQRYARVRKGHNQLALWAMQGFNGLFSNDSPILSRIRACGMNQVDRMGPVKQWLSKIANQTL